MQTSRERSSPSASAPVQTQADNNYTEVIASCFFIWCDRLGEGSPEKDCCW